MVAFKWDRELLTRPLVCAVAVLFTVGGCSEASLPPPDSSAFDARVSVLQEEIRIDGHEETLVPMSQIAVRHDGTIAVVQRQSHEVRLYSPEGEFLGAFGRQGEGPGEFHSMGPLGWWGDSLWVYDGYQARVTLISPSLELSRTIPGPQVSMVPLSFQEDGTLIAHRSTGDALVIARTNLAGEVERTLLTLPEGQGTQVEIPGVGVAYNMPFSNAPHFGAAFGADRAVMAMADLDGPDAGTFLVTAVTLAGDTVFSWRYLFDTEDIPAAEAERQVAARLAVYERELPEMVAGVRAAIQVPPVYPPFTGLLIGGDGTIWLEHRRHSDRQLYSVIGSDGDPIGALALPEENRLAAAQRNRIWVLEPDDVGVQSLVRYSVAWSES